MAAFDPFKGVVGASASDPEARRNALFMQLLAANQPPPATTPLGVASHAANGLIQGLLINKMLGDDTAKAETMAKALKAGTPWINPDTGQAAPGTGGVDAMLAVLGGDPRTASVAAQLGMQRALKTEEANTAIRQALAGQGVNYNPSTGTASEIAGYGPAKANIAGAEAGAKEAATGAAKLGYEPRLAAATEAAKNPALIARAGGEANARNESDLSYKPRIDAAETPVLVARAAQTEAATSPIKTQQAIETAKGTAPIQTQQAVDTARGVAPIQTQQAIDTAAGTAAAKLPSEKELANYKAGLDVAAAGPKAAAAFNAVPHQSAPGSTFVQFGQGGQGQTVYANPNPSPGTQPGQLDKYYADTFKGLNDAAMSGRQKLASMKQLNDILGGVETGKFTGTTLDLLKAARAVGLSTEGMNEKTGRLEAANAIGRQLATEMRNFPGQVSNYEQGILQSMAPGIEMTPQGRAQLIAINEAKQRRAETMAKIGSDYLREPGKNGRLDVGYLDRLTEFANKEGITGFGPQSSPAAPPAPAAPSQADIEFTASKYGISTDEVKRRLGLH